MKKLILSMIKFLLKKLIYVLYHTKEAIQQTARKISR